MRHLVLSLVFSCFALVAFAQHGHDGHDHGDHAGHNHADHAGHNHADHDHSGHTGHDHAAHADGGHDTHGHDDHAHGGHGEKVCGHYTHHEFNAGDNAIHHIADANVYSIGPFNIPLPVILYVPNEGGLKVFMSSVFDHASGHHGTGVRAHERFVIDGGEVKHVTDLSFPTENVAISGIVHIEDKKGKEKAFVCYNEKLYPTETKSTADAGIFGGGITNYFDFSLTKNVVSMLIVCLILFLLFRSAAKAYTAREGKAPTGLQNLLEVMVSFIRDEVAVPFLGHKASKFLPFLLSLFFFILGLNLWGQVPFFGGSNVTGNIGVTAVLAIFTFFAVNFNGNKHYWEHLFAAPGTPWFVKIILIPVEIMGMFIKPITLMLRLFANITAGHMVILIFVSFVFIFGKSGESVPGAAGGAVAATLLSLFMMSIELIVAFVQAFVFTILTASYLGQATEEAHH